MFEHLPSAADCDRELVERHGFREFIRLAFPHIPGEQATQFEPNWHIDAIADHLEAQSRGQLKDLVINVPPGHMKSVSVCVLWLPWEWSWNPYSGWIFASFDGRLTNRDADKSLQLMTSDWYRSRWGTYNGVLTLDDRKYAVSDHKNNHGGFRWSTSCPGGAVTGRHANRIVVDDPIKPRDKDGKGRGTATTAITSVQLENVADWYFGTMPTRRRKGATRTIIMQRLHTEDLVGKIKERGDDYQFLTLPAEFDPKSRCVTFLGDKPFFRDPRTDPDELLWPGLFPRERIDELKRELAEEASAQLQQNPVAKGGNIFKRASLRYWSRTPGRIYIDPDGKENVCGELPTYFRRGMSWDLSFKDTESSDFVAGGCWRSTLTDHYLEEIVMDQMDFVRTVQEILGMCRRWPDCAAKYIEDKANGPAVKSMLANQIPGLIMVEPQGSKIERAHLVQWLFRGGNVWFPNPDEYPEAKELIVQILAFPRGKNDDGVDMVDQYLIQESVTGIGMAQAIMQGALR